MKIKLQSEACAIVKLIRSDYCERIASFTTMAFHDPKQFFLIAEKNDNLFQTNKQIVSLKMRKCNKREIFSSN